MVNVANWQDWAAQVDEAVDEYFGEIVILQPWTTSDFAVGGIDTSRPAVECVAAVKMGMPTAQPGGPGFISRLEGVDITMSIQQKYINEAQLREHDAVYLKDRGLSCEVAFIPPEATNRPEIPLLRSNLTSSALLARRPAKVYGKPKGSMERLQAMASTQQRSQRRIVMRQKQQQRLGRK